MLVCDKCGINCCCDFYTSINYRVRMYRINFLKRSKINRYKRSIKGTPILIDKMINSLERKVNNVPIFSAEVKRKYFEGLNKIFDEFYTESFDPRIGRKSAYYNYLADQYCILGRGYKRHSMIFEDFIKNKHSKHYR